jgi:hypothetical protein
MNVKKIWENKSQILEGLKNNLFKTEYTEKIAQERMSICNSCELIDKTGDKCLVPGTNPCCGECGCSLSLKLRSLSSYCTHPNGKKWDQVITEEEENQLNLNE